MSGLAKLWFDSTAYWLVLATLVAWAWVMVGWLSSCRFSLREFLVRERLPIVASAVLTALIFLAVPPRYRVLADEANLVAVSQSMFLEKRADLIIDTKNFFGITHVLTAATPVRPLLYPLLTSFGHTLSGYGIHNAFAVNIGLMFVLILGSWLALRGLVGPWFAGGTIGLMLSHPVVIYVASCAGFDMLAMVMLLASLVTVRLHLAQGTRASFAGMWMTMLLFAHVRYESIALLPMVVAILLWRRRLDLRKLIDSPLTWITPILLLPLLFQQLASNNRTATKHWSKPAISVGNLAENTTQAAKAVGAQVTQGLGIRNTTPPDQPRQKKQEEATIDPVWLPYNLPLLALGTLAILFLAGMMVAGRARPAPGESRDFAWIAGVSLTFFCALYFAHFRGEFANPTQSRFFALFCVTTALVWPAIRVLTRTGERAREGGKVMFTIGAVSFLLSMGISTQQRNTKLLYIHRDVDLVRETLGRPDPNLPVLLIYDRPVIFSALGYSTLGFGTFQQQRDEILQNIRMKLFQGVYVLQRLEYATGAVEPGMEFDPPPGWRLEPVKSTQVHGEAWFRMLRLVPP